MADTGELASILATVKNPSPDGCFELQLAAPFFMREVLGFPQLSIETMLGVRSVSWGDVRGAAEIMRRAEKLRETWPQYDIGPAYGQWHAFRLKDPEELLSAGTPEELNALIRTAEKQPLVLKEVPEGPLRKHLRT